MSRSPIFSGVRRIIGIAKLCDEKKVATRDGLSLAAEIAFEHERRRISRRDFVKGVSAAAAASLAGSLFPSKAFAKKTTNARIAIVGGGLAGLVCADVLQSKGISSTIYEANPDRLGGRIYSGRDFPGQVYEKGGELIDNLHKTMLGYANEFKLKKEDLGKAPGEVFYYFNGSHYSEAAVIDEYRELVDRMRPDLQTLSGQPTFFNHTAADVLLDNTDLATYLDTRAGDLPLIRSVLDVAYNIEFGREISEQSCLNLLMFIHLDKRSKFAPFGIFSDERYHLTDGNDGIVNGIADKLDIPIVMGARLEKLSRSSSGVYLLKFAGSSIPVEADAVVMTLPFTVLRRITLEPSLGLSADKLRAINEVGYGYNAKTMIGFQGRPWLSLHNSDGTAYSNLPNVQNTWETNYTKAGATSILTDYSGGNRARDLQVLNNGAPGYCSSCHIGSPSLGVVNDAVIQQQAEAFLTDLDIVYPGVRAAATKVNGKYMVERMHWLPQSYSRGSYTCYQPGQFTSIAGLEGEHAGLLKFAGEHADSFYEWQGFMEGAALSGVAAANQILYEIKKGNL